MRDRTGLFAFLTFNQTDNFKFCEAAKAKNGKGSQKEKFRSSLFKGLQFPKAEPLVAHRSEGVDNVENLLLSTDGDIMLYEAEEKILCDLEDLIEEFDVWKKTNCFDEQLFVNFLQQKFGNKSIKFIKSLGYKIPEEYKNVKWFNF